MIKNLLWQCIGEKKSVMLHEVPQGLWRQESDVEILNADLVFLIEI